MLRKLTSAQLAFDLTLSALFLVVCLLLEGNGIGIAFMGGLLQSIVAVAVAVAMATACAFWRLNPGIALGLAWIGAAIEVVTLRGPEPADLAVPVVLFATAAWGNRAVQWLGFASAFVGALLAALTLVLRGYFGVTFTTPDVHTVLSVGGSIFLTFVVLVILFLFAWTLGLVFRVIASARERGRAAQRAQQEVAAEQERVRIARDMHDVVAHSLAVVVAQADGARYLSRKDPQATEDALATIASTARDALADVRVLLAQLRHSQGDAPQPTLVDLDRLLASVRASGLRVTEDVEGTPLDLGTGHQLAVYRIVQESLTNALRHADTAKDVLVRFLWTDDGLALRIVSALPVTKANARKTVEVPGHGIAGMAERAALVGGSLETERRDGEFVVRAWLPVHPVAVGASGGPR